MNNRCFGSFGKVDDGKYSIHFNNYLSLLDLKRDTIEKEGTYTKRGFEDRIREINGEINDVVIQLEGMVEKSVRKALDDSQKSTKEDA
tara:strand:- start:421 stop:684 length:264 start_codon:yes stop_codon:yes gene_type:complete